MFESVSRLPAMICTAAAVLVLSPLSLVAQTTEACTGKVYGRGKRAICLPQGAASFADEVVSFTPGTRAARGEFNDPSYTLGEPDYVRASEPGFLALGCNGVVVVRFTDNALVDVQGPDLYIFEVGPLVEETELAISEDGTNWLEVGRIEGARADVDIAAVAKPFQTFSYVRLTNASKACGGRTPGADIDAVAAVGSAMRLSLDGTVLFDTGESTLKPEAEQALAALVPRITAYGASSAISVEGHTDNVGDASSNQRLSEARARSVWAFLSARLSVDADRVRTVGFGQTRPIAGNDTEEGRATNRRVDILVMPSVAR